MKTRMSILKTVVVGAMVVALGGAALGATSSGNGAGGMTAAENATASIDLPGAAASVIASLVGGTNPSTSLSNDSDHATNQTDVTHETEATENEATETDVDNDKDNDVEAGHDVAPSGTSGTRPGFGCGDDNHKHSGPPGRPGATMPPGCTKH